MASRTVMMQRDLRTILAIVAAGSDGTAADPLPEPVLQGLLELVDCDNVSFIGFAQDQQKIHFDQEIGDPGPTGEAHQSWLTAFWEHYWDYRPFYEPELVTNFTNVVTMSDFLSRRQIRDSGMYSDCLRPIDVEHVLTLCLPHSPGRTLRVNFYRGAGPEFSQRDRDLLTILRPHLDLIYRSQCHRRHPPPALTPREWEVLHLVAAGRTNRQIGRQLSISEATARKHLEHVFARLGVSSRTEAVNRAFGKGVPEPSRFAAGPR